MYCPYNNGVCRYNIKVKMINYNVLPDNNGVWRYYIEVKTINYNGFS